MELIEEKIDQLEVGEGSEVYVHALVATLYLLSRLRD